MFERGVWAGVALGMLLAAGPAAGLQRAERPGLWIVEPGEVVTWDGYADSAYLFGKLEGAPIYGRLSLRDPEKGFYGAGGFGVTFVRRGEGVYPVFEGGRWRLPRVRIERIWVRLDGRPFVTIEDPEPRSIEFGLAFPYAVRAFEVGWRLSTGREVGVRVRYPEALARRAAGHDARTQFYLKEFRHPSTKVTLHYGYALAWGCFSTRALGRIRKAEAWLERHEVLAPEGRVTIGRVLLHEPLLEFAIGNWQFWYKLRYGEWVHRDMRVRIGVACETERGKRIAGEHEHVIPANPYPSGGGARVAPY